MSKNMKSLIIKTLILTILLGTAVCAVENDLSIEAVLSNSIKLKLNGKDWAPKDPASGNYYKPIVYQGRVYLPVRVIIEEAAGMPVDYDGDTRTVWIGGKKEIVNVDDVSLYKDYYGTMLTTDKDKLATPDGLYRWGITNDKDMSMQYFSFYLIPDGKYKNFRGSFFIDKSVEIDLIMDIRKETRDGTVIKSITLKPGETIKDLDIDISGVSKLWFTSELTMKHGRTKKAVIGEPIFYNGNL